MFFFRGVVVSKVDFVDINFFCKYKKTCFQNKTIIWHRKSRFILKLRMFSFIGGGVIGV